MWSALVTISSDWVVIVVVILVVWVVKVVKGGREVEMAFLWWWTMIHVVGSGGRGSGFNFDYPLQAHPRPPILTFSTLSIFHHCYCISTLSTVWSHPQPPVSTYPSYFGNRTRFTALSLFCSMEELYGSLPRTNSYDEGMRNFWYILSIFHAGSGGGLTWERAICKTQYWWFLCIALSPYCWWSCCDCTTWS